MNPNHQEAVTPQGAGRPSFPSNGGFRPVVTPTTEERGAYSPHSSYSTALSGMVTPDPPSPLPEIVKLDVGGFKFTTSRSTLCSVPGSHLEAMFSGRHPMGALLTDNGAYFIDRDGRHFHHVLNYLRSGSVITLPSQDQLQKEELAIEADFFGLDDLVRAIRMPKMDLMECVGKETLGHWEAEAKLRRAFSSGEGKNFAKMDPFRGLIPLFPEAGAEEECPYPMPLVFNPMSEVLQKGKHMLFMNNLRTSKDTKDAPLPVTVQSLEEFNTNFNKEWPNVMHRLQDILLEEPVIMAGGSVLRALTASKGIRRADWWNTEWKVAGKSDIDLFLYGCCPEEANRISRRIFYALAWDNERWIALRSKGVVNLHLFDDDKLKIQIVLRIYDSPTEVLIGFDLDSCCCTYNGRNVWVCPRWIPAIQSGVNILNPLHAWPNKPSYEFRLAKYAFRGFAVSVPGIDKERIDYDLIRRTKLTDLKGLARLVSIASEMETAPSTKKTIRNYMNGQWQYTTFNRPKTPREITNLREGAIGVMSEDLRMVELVDLSYSEDALVQHLLVPSVYITDHDRLDWELIYEEIEISRETRDSAWAEILDGGEGHPKLVPRCLLDAWDTSKRSREYLNSQMDKYDLDNLYYSKAYNED